MDEWSEQRHDFEQRVRGALADADAVGPEPDLAEVRRHGGRRRRGARVLAGAGAAVVLVAGGVVVADVVRTSSDDGSIVTQEPDVTPPSVVSTPTSTPTPSTQLADEVPATVPALTGPVAGPTAIEAGQLLAGSMVVPWGDGFLRVTTEQSQTPPPELTDEVREAFPQQVRDLFVEPPRTIAEAQEVLEDHPDEMAIVTDLINSDPDLRDAIFGEQGPSTARLETSPDGTSWTSAGAIELPEPLTWINYAAAYDGRLAILAQGIDDDAPAPSPTISSRPPRDLFVVLTTTDLQTWDTLQELTSDDSSAPAGFTRSSYATALDVGPSGVVVIAQEQLNFDPLPLLPADVRAVIESNGSWGMSFDESGITIDVDGAGAVSVEPPEVDDGVAAAATTVVVSNAPSESFRFTWDELGVDSELANNPESSVSVWSGDPATGALVVTTRSGYLSGASLAVAPEAGGFVATVPSDTGTALLVSVDGQRWTDVALTEWRAMFAQTLVDTPAGVLLLGIDGSATSAWLAAPGLEKWSQTESSAALRSDGYVVSGDGGAAGAVIVQQVSPGSQPVSGEAVIERDGYRLTFTLSGASDTRYRLTRVGADGSEEELLLLSGEAFFDSDVVELSPEGDLTISDPGTGEALVTFTQAESEAAYVEAFPDDGTQDSQVLELLHTADGTSWAVLDRIESGRSAGSWVSSIDVAVGAGRVVWLVERYPDDPEAEFVAEPGEIRIYDVTPG